MSYLVLTGGGELNPSVPAGRVLAKCDKVAVITLAAAFRRPEALRADIRVWADAICVDHVVVGAVRRSECLDPLVGAPVADADGVLVLDGSPAHLVGALKATPLLDSIVNAQAAGAMVVWSGTAASAVCDPMVDERGGAFTVGLGLYKGIAVATGWEQWPLHRRRRLRRMLPESVLFMVMESGAAVASKAGDASSSESTYSSGQWAVIGGTVDALQADRPVNLTSVSSPLVND